MTRYNNSSAVMDMAKVNTALKEALRSDENAIEQPAIPYQVMLMDKSICELRDLVEKLRCRLSPVLQPPATGILRDGGKCAETCPLADTLAEMNDAINGVIQVVNDIHAANHYDQSAIHARNHRCQRRAIPEPSV